MQLPHVLHLLLVVMVSASGGKVVTNDTASTQRADTHRFMSKYSPGVGGAHSNGPSYGGKTVVEERGIFSSSLSKIKGVFGKKIGLGNLNNSLRKNPSVVVVLDDSPTMKMLETAMEKDPNFFTKLATNPELAKKLASNPEVARISSTLEKSKIKLNKDDITQLRTVIAENPSKANKFIAGLEVLRGLMTMTLFAGFAGFILYLGVMLVLTTIKM